MRRYCGLWYFAVPFPDGAVALMLVVILSAIALVLFRRHTEEKDFVTMVFLVALAIRLGFGLMIEVLTFGNSSVRTPCRTTVSETPWPTCGCATPNTATGWRG